MFCRQWQCQKKTLVPPETYIWGETPDKRGEKEYKKPRNGEKILLSKLGETNPGSMDSGSNSRAKNTNNREPKTIEISKTNYLLDKNRNFNFTGEKGCCQSFSKKRPIFIELIPNRKERTGHVQTRDKSKGPELTHSLSEIQDGDPEGCKRCITTEGLHGENRSKRCVFLNPTRPGVQEICEVPMGRQSLRIPMPDVRAGSSTENVYQVVENTDFSIEEVTNQDSDIHRRYFDYDLFDKGSKSGQRHNDLPTSKLGVYNKLQKIGAGASSTLGILRGVSKQPHNDLQNTGRENTKAGKPMCRNLKQNKVPLNKVASTIGNLMATVQAFSPAPLQLRYLQKCLSQNLKRSNQNYESYFKNIRKKLHYSF